MGRIKAFLKRDSDILRNPILFLFCLISGISKLIYDHRISGIFIGLLCIIGSIFLFVDILKEFKRLNSVKVETTKVEEDVKGKRFNEIGLLFIWIFGLYFLFYKNDEAMVGMIPIFSYLIIRDSFKHKENKHKGL